MPSPTDLYTNRKKGCTLDIIKMGMGTLTKGKMDCDYVPKKKSKRQLKKEKRGMSEEQFLSKMNEERATLGK